MKRRQKTYDEKFSKNGFLGVDLVGGSDPPVGTVHLYTEDGLIDRSTKASATIALTAFDEGWSMSQFGRLGGGAKAISARINNDNEVELYWFDQLEAEWYTLTSEPFTDEEYAKYYGQVL